VSTLCGEYVLAQDSIRRSGILNHNEQSIGVATGMDYAILIFILTEVFLKQELLKITYLFPTIIFKSE